MIECTQNKIKFLIIKPGQRSLQGFDDEPEDEESFIK